MAQATLGPFIYDDAGFQVQVTVGSGTQRHSRMDCEQLYALITSSKPHAAPHGTSSGFYAAQLQHYGLPVPASSWPNNVAQALETFKAVFKLKDGKHKLSVPAAISSIKKKLKDNYVQLTARANEERIARIQAELAEIEKAKKAEEQLKSELKSLQSLAKGKKRKVFQTEADTLAASTSSLSVEPNESVQRVPSPAAASGHAADEGTKQLSGSKKRRTEAASGQVTGIAAADGESAGVSKKGGGGRPPLVVPSSQGKSDNALQPKPLHAILVKKLSGVWRISTRAQPDGTAGWIAMAKINHKSFRSAQTPSETPYGFVGHFMLHNVEGDFCGARTACASIGECIKSTLRWSRSDDLAAFSVPGFPSLAQAPTATGASNGSPLSGRLELFFDGTNLDGYLSGMEPFQETLAFQGYGDKSDIRNHPLSGAWASAVWSAWTSTKKVRPAIQEPTANRDTQCSSGQQKSKQSNKRPRYTRKFKQVSKKSQETSKHKSPNSIAADT